MDDNVFRLQYMIRRMIDENNYVRIEDLAQELFVSRATLDRLMPELKDVVKEYHLEVLIKPKYGIALGGTEKDKRICYAHQTAGNEDYQYAELSRRVEDILTEVIRQYQLELADINIYNLVQHCVITLHRIGTGNQLPSETENTLEDTIPERQAAKTIAKRFSEEFHILFPESEEQYVAMHLLGKRTLTQTQVIRGEIFDCIEEILEEIYKRKGIDLREDDELKSALALHVQPMIDRLKYGLKQDNPLLQEIKTDMSKGYELALCAMDVIEGRYQYAVNENEAGYLALHFAVALDQQGKKEQQKKIVLVCATGKGTAKLIAHRLSNQYHFRQENMVITSVHRLAELNFGNIMCILTTLPLKEEYPVPVVSIEATMGRQSQINIDAFLKEYQEEIQERASQLLIPSLDPELFFPNMSFSNRKEVIDFMCDAIAEKYPQFENIKEETWKREQLSTTEVGNQLALPHPYDYNGDKICISVMTLKKPIRWKFQLVKLVILLALPKEESQESELISDGMAKIASDKAYIHKLLVNPTPECLNTILQ